MLFRSLKLQDHIAAMDLEVLGRAMLTRDDDLALATLLKTPLIGLDDDALMALAPERPGSLADALDAVNNASPLATARDKIKILREAAFTQSPFEFYAFVLGPFGGRRAFRARLGAEAEDALDEFLRLALEYEQKAMPSLRAFLAEFSATTLEIKRDMDAVRDEIRVMTVHGAKGLEAPIVILAAAALIVQTYMHSRKAALGGGISLSLAIIALTFRTVDLSVCSYIPMGTHFLWHSFLSCAGFVGLYTLTGLEAVKWGRRRGALPNPAE